MEKGSKKGSNNVLAKIIISVLFLLILLNILFLKFNPLPGYAYSFYEHVPNIFWIFSIIVFFGSSILLLEFRFLQNKFIYLLFFLILLNNAVILFSPYICGIVIMNDGDILSHAGLVLDIFYNGKIYFDINFYPLTHILAFSISSLSNIGYMDSVKILSPIFTLLLPLYFYILSKDITDNRFVQNLTFLISSTFYLSSLFHPNSITTPRALSFLMLPLLFLLFIKSTHTSEKSLSFLICLLLTFSAYVFFHPITSIVLISFLVLLYVLRKSTKMQFNYSGSLFFICAVLAYFIYLTKVWIKPIRNIYFILQGYKIPLGYWVDIQEQLNKLGLAGFNLTLFIIKMFGNQAMLLLLSFLSVIFLLFRQGKKYENWFLAILAFFLTSGILLLTTIVMPSSMNIGFWRFLPFLMVFSPILSSLFLSKLHKRIIVIPVLLFLFITSLLVVYPSPYINQTNSQLTYMTLSGSRWILEHKNSEIGLSGYFGHGTTIGMISGLIPYSQFCNERYSMWYTDKSTIPDHLGYEKHSNIWDTIQEERYLIISKYDIVAYTQVYSNLGRISLEDIEKAKNDYTALFVYDNGEYEVFYISR